VVIEKYLWKDLPTLLATYTADDNLFIKYNYSDARTPNSATYAGNTYYLMYDQVGSLRTVSDVNGNVVKELTYDSFGNILSDTLPSVQLPFGFAGGLYDSDTKLIRFGYRDYYSVTEKWTAKDPIGFDGGDTSLYGYVLGDPVNFVDVDGLKSSGYTQGGGVNLFAGVAGGSANIFFAEVYGDNGVEVGTFIEICIGLGLGLYAEVGSNTGVCEVDDRLDDLAGPSIGLGGGLAYGSDGISGDAQIGAHSISGNSDLGVFPSVGLGAHGGIKGCYTKRLD